MEEKVILNKDQSLYVIASGSGYSCLGFANVMKKIKSLSCELGLSAPELKMGSKAAYSFYRDLVFKAQLKHKATGWKSSSELVPSLIGLEGKKVEGLYFGEKIRFMVGKSMGWIPVHLVIKTSRSDGGESLLADEFQFSKIVY